MRVRVNFVTAPVTWKPRKSGWPSGAGASLAGAVVLSWLSTGTTRKATLCTWLRQQRSLKVLRVQKKMCKTCIYRPGHPNNLEKLENDVRDPQFLGFFVGYRMCHHTPSRLKICCAGFWKRHKHKFALGQIAQRLGWVEKVEVDTHG